MEPSREELQAELASLNAANAALKRQLAQEATGNAGAPATSQRKKRGWGWTVLSVALVTIGAVLAPVAVVSVWAHHELTDTAYFVDTFAPLADEPEVQEFVAEEAILAIESKLDIDQLADDLFMGLDDLGIGPRAKEALDLLKAPAVAGVKGLISKTVTDFVRSDAFSQVWEEALTVAHTQFVNTATGQKDAAITVGPHQEISLQLGPIIEAAKAQLVADGFALADRIPAISRTVVLAESSSIGTYLMMYQVVVAVGAWLPWVALLLLAAGVLVARRRPLALAWASGALLLVMVLVGSGIDVGRNVFALAVSPAIPHGAAVVLYAGVLVFVSNLVLVVGVLAATVLAVTAFAGPWRWARTLRDFATSAFAGLRNRAERHGITTGGAGTWLYRWRTPLWVGVAAACSAVILFSRPLTPTLIVWVAVVGVITVAALELASRPPEVSVEDETTAG